MAISADMPIPGPKSYPIIGNIPDIEASASLQSFLRHADTYGDIFRLNVPGTRLVVVSSVALVDEVCDEKRFKKVPNNVLSEIRNGVHDGLFTAHNEEPNWGIAHRVLMPAFGPTGIRDMFDDMHDIASQLVLKWARQGPSKRIHVTDDLTRLALDTLALCSMGFRFNNFYSEKPHPFVESMARFLVECGKRPVRPPLPGFVYSAENKQYAHDIEVLRSTAEEVLRERTASASDGNSRKDLLAAMMSGRDSQTGQKMTDASIVDNLITFLIAGHETTSGTLSYAMFNLLRNPEAYKKLQKEVDDVIGTGPITVQHMQKLPYIEAVLRETLRLQAPIPIFSRTAAEDNTLLGGRYRVNKSDTLLLLLAKSHLDPTVFDNPLEFRPERMLGENFRNLPKHAWKPFGTGMRACIGRPFAWQESILALAMMFQKLDFELDDPGYKLRHEQTLTIKPKDLYVKAKLRHSETATGIVAQVSGPTAIEKRTANTANDSRAAPQMQQGIPNASTKACPMTVLYGSNSGTCETMARTLALDAPAHGYRVSRLEPLDAAVDKLPTDDNQPFIIVTASYEGQPADNAAKFVPWLESLQQKQRPLHNLKYAVFGNGSREWPQTLHRIPKLINDTLHEAGGERLVDIGLADAASDDLFDEFETWKCQKLWPVLEAAVGSVSTTTSLPPPALKVKERQTNRAALLGMNLQVARVTSARSLTHGPGTPLPFAGKLAEKRHLELELPPLGVHDDAPAYRPGDYLTVLPCNPPETVLRALRRFGLARDAIVSIEEVDSCTGALAGCAGILASYVRGDMSAYSILSDLVELGAVATRRDLAALAEVAVGDVESVPCPFAKKGMEEYKAALGRMASSSSSSGSKADSGVDCGLYETEVLAKKLSILDILEMFPRLDLPFGTFLGMVPTMRPRQYSISSSPIPNPRRATLTYSVLAGSPTQSTSTTTDTPGQVSGAKMGVASSYLASLQPGDLIRVSVRPAHEAFHLPPVLSKDQSPIIMISAGTGIAPFRGFIEDRAAALLQNRIHDNRAGNVDGKEGQKAPVMILYHGCRTSGHDDLYASELARWEALGVVQVRRVFSRGADGRSGYVQDALWQDREELFRLCGRGNWKEVEGERGARVYICGSRKMSEEVAKVARRAKRENMMRIADTQSGLGAEMADEELMAWWQGLIASRRVVVDVFD